MRDMSIGFIIGWMLSLPVYLYWVEPSAEDAARDYAAYRACIPKPNCMTAQDYIDYYDLKWRLEK